MGGAASWRERAKARENPWRVNAMLFGGIFFTFAPFGVLLGLIQKEPAGWFFALLLSLLSGGLAAGWAFVLQRGGWWYALIAVLVLFPAVGVPWLIPWMGNHGLLRPGYGMSPLARQIVLVVMATLFLAVGYTLTVQYIRHSERLGARARAELDVARRMHESIVPEVRRDGPIAAILARSIPSSEMGGDLVDVVERPGEVDVFLADVSGHGVGAGIVMGMVKGAIRTKLLAGGGLGEMVSDLNRVLVDLTRPEMFATLACLRIGERGRVEYALAGHLPIYHRRARDGGLSTLNNESLPLGIVGGEPFGSRVMEAEPGDLLAVFTDGLTEVQDASGRLAGLGPIERILRDKGGGPLGELFDAILASAQSAGGQMDDQSLVLVRVL